MTDDILERAKALCDKTYRGGQTISARNAAYARRFTELVELVPGIITKVERLEAAVEHELNHAKAQRLWIEEQEGEIERLRSEIMQPIETFGTPELVAWIEDMHRLVVDYPESERGQIPFVMTMGELLTRGMKSWTASRDAKIKELSEKFDKYALAWAEIINQKAVRTEELEALNESLMENGNDLRERCQKAEALNERLEAAFLEKHIEYQKLVDDEYGMSESPTDEEMITEARAALEEIKAKIGSGNHIVGANHLILTTKQQEALGRILKCVHKDIKYEVSAMDEEVLRDLLDGQAGGKDESRTT